MRFSYFHGEDLNQTNAIYTFQRTDETFQRKKKKLHQFKFSLIFTILILNSYLTRHAHYLN